MRHALKAAANGLESGTVELQRREALVASSETPNSEPRTPKPELKARFHPMIGDVKASEMAQLSYEERYFSTIAPLAI